MADQRRPTSAQLVLPSQARQSTESNQAFSNKLNLSGHDEPISEEQYTPISIKTDPKDQFMIALEYSIYVKRSIIKYRSSRSSIGSSTEQGHVSKLSLKNRV